MDNCCVFENNVVGPFPYSNSSGVSVGYGDTGCKIDNNTIVGCSQTGLNLDTAGGGTYAANEVKNNIVQGCAVGLNDQNGIVHTNNLLYSNTTEYQNGAQSAGEIVGQIRCWIQLYPAGRKPCYRCGLLVGLPFNGNWPDIGAFETGCSWSSADRCCDRNRHIQWQSRCRRVRGCRTECQCVHYDQCKRQLHSEQCPDRHAECNCKQWRR